MRKLGIIILLLIVTVRVHANCATGTVTTPVVDSISVDLAGNVTICWQALADPDIVTYAIFTINPFTGAFDSINSVAAPTNCFTMPAALNGSDTSSVQYSIRAYDVCGNAGALGGGNFHGTIYLQKTENPCTGSILLNWTAYDDFTSGTNVLYSIYVSENAGPYTIAGTVAFPSTSFNYLGVNQGSNYNFYIQVSENAGAGPFNSYSNDLSVNGIDFLKDPNPTYLYTATVVDSLQIDLSFYVDTAADISYYDIKRAVQTGGPYSSIGSISAYTGMPEWLQFSDLSINANSTYYAYIIEAINICGLPKDTSNIGRTVWLKVKPDGINATNTLTITQYDGWLGNVQSYDIYRAVAGVWESSPVVSISSFTDTTVYVDDITSVFYGNGEYCYKIIANEGAVIHPDGGNLPATSISNESCVFHDPLVYVPNAFIPSGNYNSEFKPILTFANPDSYLFQVYNKWGQKIFESKNVGETWNGRMNNTGTMCQVDSYVYVVQFESSSGEQHSKRGVVSLLR